MSDLEQAARECEGKLMDDEFMAALDRHHEGFVPILVAFARSQRAAVLREAADSLNLNTLKDIAHPAWAAWLRALADKEQQ